jgi:hypothetical protein
MVDTIDPFRVDSLENRVSSLESKMVSVQTIVKTAEKGVHVDYITAHDRVGTENRNDALLGTGTIQILENVVFGQGVQLSAPSIQLTAGTPLDISSDSVIADDEGNLGFQSTGVIPSDPRLKEDISELGSEDEEAIIRRFEGVPLYRYKYTKDAAKYFGVPQKKYMYGPMANEFFTKYPESVKTRNLSNVGLPEDTYLIDLEKEMVHRDIPAIVRYLLRENRELKSRLSSIEQTLKEFKQQSENRDK